MSTAALKYLSDLMAELGVPYAFMRWNKKTPQYYFVGVYNEVLTPTREEEGRQETTVILRGYTKGSWMLLEQARETIEGITRTDILPNGNGIAIMYSNGYVVPIQDADMKSIQINLTIQEWKVTR